MAGIGFALRKHLDRGTYTGELKAYAIAGAVGSGPWVLSMGGMAVIGLLAAPLVSQPSDLPLFTASVSYAIAASLILSGPVQLWITRYIADRTYEERRDLVIPNVLGALMLLTVGSGAAGALAAWTLLDGSLAYRMLVVAAFATLNGVWLLSVLLSSMKEYRLLLTMFAAGYLLTVVGALALAGRGTEGMLLGFVLGHCVLLFGMLGAVLRGFPTERLLGFEFFRRDRALITLAAIGLAYQLGVWADKVLFWCNPVTSVEVAGPLRVSLVYDLPIFLAYLSMLPGMSLFLLRIETDFAESYDGLFATIRKGGTLAEIQSRRDELIAAVRAGLQSIFRIQGLTVVALFFAAPSLYVTLGLPAEMLHIFYFDLVGVGAQVLLLAVLTVAFYLDYRPLALALCLLFFVSNTLLTGLTFELGPATYGLGFALSTVLTSLVGLLLLGRHLDRLDYDIFMR